MARLTQTDKEAFRELTERGWVNDPAEQSPRFMPLTTEAREAYCRWATEAAKFHKGIKPVNFSGDHWKL